MKNICLSLVLIVLFFSNARAESYQKTDLGIKSVIKSVGIEIQFYSPSTVRILKWPDGEDFTKKSLSVIKTPQKTNFSVKQHGDELSLKSEKIVVVVNLKSGRVSFKTPAGEPLLNEKNDGVSFVDFNDAGEKTYTVAQSFVLDKDEAIYGLGIQQKGNMVQRNLKMQMVQNNTEDFVAFFQSVKG